MKIDRIKNRPAEELKSYPANKLKGFSLIELLIYTAILAVMATVIVNVFLGITMGRGQFVAESEVNSNLRFAVEKINQDIRSASVVTAPASPGGTSSSNIIMTTVDGEITYCISSNRLRRQVNGICDDSSLVVTSDKVNVTAITFTRFENTNTTLSVTAVTIQTSITMVYAGSVFQYSATKTTTESLP